MHEPVLGFVPVGMTDRTRVNETSVFCTPDGQYRLLSLTQFTVETSPSQPMGPEPMSREIDLRGSQSELLEGDEV